MAEVSGDTKTLLVGLTDEAGLYTKVLSLSTEELQLVKDAELEKATAVLSLKQQKLEQIAEIEARIKPHKERWPQIKAGLPPTSLVPFQEALKELSDLLEKLIAVERETEETLSQQIVTVRKGIPAVAAEERARKAYGAQREGKKKD